MDKAEIEKALNLHAKWARGDSDGVRANFIGANLSGANLIGANLTYANLTRAKLIGAKLRGAALGGADLSGADLSGAILNSANLRGAVLIGADLIGAALGGADLSSANLIGADLTRADLIGADLSGAGGIVSNIEFLERHFKRTPYGFVAYKTFNEQYNSPSSWVIKEGSVITENVNFSRTQLCGCGINVAPLEWVRQHCRGKIWSVMIRWEWLAGVCCPYGSDGKIRCERCELIGIVNPDQDEEEYSVT